MNHHSKQPERIITRNTYPHCKIGNVSEWCRWITVPSLSAGFRRGAAKITNFFGPLLHQRAVLASVVVLRRRDEIRCGRAVTVTAATLSAVRIGEVRADRRLTTVGVRVALVAAVKVTEMEIVACCHLRPLRGRGRGSRD